MNNLHKTGHTGGVALGKETACMLRAISEPGPNLSAKEARALFDLSGYIVPESYVAFLAQHNGGVPEPNYFPIDGMSQNPYGDMQEFFSIGTNVPASDLREVVKDFTRTVPKGILPIGCSGGGDYICLDLRKVPAPVVFFDFHSFWGNNVWSENHLYRVSSDFDQFLHLLGDYPIG